ncbi:MAG: Gfo/Idh/MocA family oxidoreductase [Blautia sp.]|nr:Gfo/Idh/MocA family oxidoreductase [Blautia sp.]
MAKLRYGMVGGGPGSFIGGAHRTAIRIADSAEIVAGSFSRDYEKTKATGAELGIKPERCYATYTEMAKAESEREDGIDFVVVVTPNNSHYAACKAFLEHGINVVCDKPLALNIPQAEELVALAEEKKVLFMVTYVYTGHVTAKYIREYIRNGAIGEVRTVMSEYPQGWLYNENDHGGKQGEWRCDPERSGRVNCLGDLGTHAENLVHMMTGLTIKRILARMDVVVPNRVLDDNDQVLIEYSNGATGMQWCSQFAIGHDNSLKVRIYGSKGTIIWEQEASEHFTLVQENGISQTIKRGYSNNIAQDDDHNAKDDPAAKYVRLPAEHNEGYLEAMANLYQSYISCVCAKKEGTFTEDMIDFPTVEDGCNSVKFVSACLDSNDNGNIWVDIK